MSIQAINNISAPQAQNTRQASFKGSYIRTEKGTPYYKTHSAMKIGGTLAGLTTIPLISALAFKKYLRADQKMTVPMSIIMVAANLGSAAFIDNKRNEKSKETAEYIREVGVNNAMNKNPNISVSKNHHPYYESNVGGKYGGWLGAISGLLYGIGCLPLLKGNDTPLEVKISTIAMLTGMHALGGWLLGKWSDNIANNDSRKHA